MGVKQVLVRPRYGDEDVVDQSPPPPMSSSPCGRYVLHRVCRFDTLAGVAIKYGVEVADVKRANGLTTDLQMFAHKTLRVPLHGRHAPSPPSSSPSHAAREWTKNAASLDPLLKLKPPRSTVSPSMSLLLQGCHGLTPAPKGDLNLTDECAQGHHRKAGSLSSTLLPRRAGQGLALRPKSGGRADTNGIQQDLLAAWVPSYGDGLRAVKRSSSAPEFQDSDSVSLASAWLKSKWNLKPDYAFTLALFDGISKPLLDSIPKPLLDNIPNSIVAWRNKAARD
ncbi:LysM and putative peptidoglycan-binding domain-containing protein 2 [Zea mays]|uniref:LysM and putative peptidoglycan-binding domain-containing protein 2 n=1 Tax=Zea mays TaxID=4577 RepID=A0A317YIK9_MAIZE|nr:LysM and putative peptidoglycan-binding domain-containing protein 2 [Zea mays]